MRSLFESCEPRPDILQGQVRESDFAADLAQVLNKSAPPEYGDAATFLANTHATGLKALLASRPREGGRQPGALRQWPNSSKRPKVRNAHRMGRVRKVRLAEVAIQLLSRGADEGSGGSDDHT